MTALVPMLQRQKILGIARDRRWRSLPALRRGRTPTRATRIRTLTRRLRRPGQDPAPQPNANETRRTIRHGRSSENPGRRPVRHGRHPDQDRGTAVAAMDAALKGLPTAASCRPTSPHATSWPTASALSSARSTPRTRRCNRSPNTAWKSWASRTSAKGHELVAVSAYLTAAEKSPAQTVRVGLDAAPRRRQLRDASPGRAPATK
jgi:hypothetical protein